ncbi:hypothetical protein TVAG_275740 [Trichomonas vaginalis G3]|uniref:Uncharacterized protein n=1 Tax=Trichomonas vaginalis (strain ATCC PRA-98 / G3) TaxID=412133 RepID=A2EYE7_TRIV3|nr:hypothetical protein TVAGG3_0864030 [Trichomonas vaginalis G3]EAY02300.1 hypothetical protein TVAG_275740 [Trichomonas vaginalis G3]KAI5500883.1 hypothetical protein TVAGG3_0864030 [Trichomonas vaginalis G3]|eukprot:XP_001314615.1 hypothetical protein [Trichomonas vaginalis G3]
MDMGDNTQRTANYTIYKLQKELQKANEKIQLQEKQINDLRIENSKLRGNIGVQEDLQSQNTALRQIHEHMTKEHKIEIENFKRQISQLKSKLDFANANTEDQIREYQYRISKLEQEIKTLKDTCKSKNQRIEDLKNAPNRTIDDEDINRLNETIQIQNSTIDSLKDTIVHQNTQISNLSRAVTETQSQINISAFNQTIELNSPQKSNNTSDKNIGEEELDNNQTMSDFILALQLDESDENHSRHHRSHHHRSRSSRH